MSSGWSRAIFSAQIRASSTTSRPFGSLTVAARGSSLAMHGRLPHGSDRRRLGRISGTRQPTQGGLMQSVLLDAAGHRRSPATMPGYHRGRPPRNKGEQYPADPPTVEEIVAVMGVVGDRAEGHRLRALIVLLWR